MKLKILFLIVLGALLFELACFWWHYRRSMVLIANRSGSPITNVQINLVGTVISEQPVGEIKNAQTRRIRIFPRGESSISISFKLDSGQTISSPATYIEPSGGYLVTFLIEADGSVSTRTHLRFGCLLDLLWGRNGVAKNK